MAKPSNLKTKVVAVAVPLETYQYVTRRAAAESMTVSTYVRRIIMREMATFNEKARKA